MTNLQIISSLLEKNLYHDLLKKGFISLKIDMYFHIFESYEQYLMTAPSKMDAITFTAMDYKCSEGTVYNAIKFMKL